ncbi:PA2779 family protein [Pseudomonas sp. N040]|uniref:PA2779 family protein n=1 Tax=Pseudomonas sp. N040 TaxID=2785325 RepID=UPI0018A25FED|nr:PA2779 family protein [Pseudomonas sp. N040]MBF7729331.1 PA2779 family protein [Pseudomonas sp. N040]MBW7012971.1 PA2779 family protein [Pseudomonas sp. N040]
MRKHSLNRMLAAALTVLHLLFVLTVPAANASLLGTAEILAEQQQQQQKPLDRQQLQAMLDHQGVQKKLTELGVDRAQVAQRINSLTPAELAQFNQQLDEAPAGGIIGIIVLFLVVFIITDMLCATDIFSFVKCINR